MCIKAENVRILYIHQYFLTPAHAGGTRSWSLSHLLWQKGHQVTVISGAVNYQTGQHLGDAEGILVSREIFDGIEVLRVGFALPGYHNFLMRILNLFVFMLLTCLISLRLPRPDVIFATSSPITVAIPALLLHWFRGVPIVFEVRDLWPDFPIQYGVLTNSLLIRLGYALESLIYRRSKTIVTTSPRMRQRIISKGVDRKRVFCLPIGVDITEFHPNLASQKNVRLELGLSEQDLLVVYAGAHGIPNALDTLVEAAGLLRDDSVHFLLLGDGRYKRALQQQAKHLGVCGRVHFWPSCARRDLGPILANADLCIITARGLEAAQAILPNKLFDYLASGKAVLVNFPGDTADLLTSTGSGMVVRAEDSEALACAIRDLSVNRPLLHHMGARARQVAEEQFDRNVLYQSLVDLIESVAASSQA